MSVLYKALQKAEKENEQRHATRAGLDPDRLAESGAIRGTRSRRFNWRVIGLSITGIFVVVMGAAYYLASTGTLTPPQQTAAVTPQPQNPAAQVPVVTQPATGTPDASAAATTPAAPQTTITAVAPAPAAAPAENPPASATVAAAPQPAESAPPAAVAEATPPAEPEAAAKAPVAQTAAAKPATVAAAPKPPQEPRGLPQVALDSPARMLSPPISVKREGYVFAGAGDAIQVREVSNQAQSDVRLGYTALINGQYDTALGFYERASKSEPTSVLALLGRGTAYQKLGREEDARAAYEAALKIDPQNREALTNVTGLIGQTQPEEALKRLIDLEGQYANFSPIPAQIGLTYAKMGNAAAAIEYLRRAITLTPDAPMYHYNLAVIFDRAGQREQAIASYKEVLDLTDSRNVTGLSRVDIQRRLEFLAVQH